MRYFLVVGEASADLHASRLIRAIKEIDCQAEFMFIGGDLMSKEANCFPLVHYKDLAFMGLIPVLKNLGTIKRSAKKMQKAMLEFKPDVVIPIDYAGFNLRYVLPFVKENLSCPIVYYIAPKLWAWKKWRIKKIKAYTDLLLTILPFEKPFFEAYGMKTEYVGNPCVEATLDIRKKRERGEVKEKKQIAILAGSRQQEIASNLSVMLEAVRDFSDEYKLVVAGAPARTEADYSSLLESYPQVELRFGETYEILAESEVAIVTSGTASLETALIGTPQVVCYRMGGLRITRWVWDNFFSVPYFSLVNLILGREAVKELIGAEVNPSNIKQHLSSILHGGSERSKQLADIKSLKEQLGTEPIAEQVAYFIHNTIRTH